MRINVSGLSNTKCVHVCLQEGMLAAGYSGLTFSLNLTQAAASSGWHKQLSLKKILAQVFVIFQVAKSKTICKQST